MIQDYKTDISYTMGNSHIYLIDVENNIKNLKIDSFTINNGISTYDLSYFGDYDLTLNFDIDFIIVSDYDGVKYLYEPNDILLTKRNDYISSDSIFSTNYIVLSFGIKSEVILDELIVSDSEGFLNVINSFRRDIKLKDLGI